MSINKYIALIGLVTIASLAIYIAILKKEKEQIQRSYQTELENRKSIDALETSLLANSYTLQKASWIHSIYGIDDEIVLTNREDSKIKLIDKLNGLTLLFSLDSNMCSPCLDREIENMKVLTSSFKSLNLIVAAQGFPSNYVFNDSKFKGLEPNVFTVQKNPFKAGLLVESPTFALFENKTPLFFYHPDKNHNLAFDKLLQVFETSLTDR